MWLSTIYTIVVLLLHLIASNSTVIVDIVCILFVSFGIIGIIQLYLLWGGYDNNPRSNICG